MNSSDGKIRIVVTGPESTGKTTLSKMLAWEFNGAYIEEYARSYIENLNGSYTFDDIGKIAEEQKKQYDLTRKSNGRIFFFDTWLIITKVWFEWVYNKMPWQLDKDIRSYPIDLFLLCRPDLPWESDNVRENGGENRIKLFESYREEILNYGFRCVEIDGLDDLRFQMAVREIKSIFPCL